jgi:cryptochrome
LSASRFFYQYFRVYSPVSFYTKYDKTGEYVKKYCPELANYPPNLIYQPWKASAADQKKYGAIVGKDYPLPVVDHDVERPRNMERMKHAFANQDKIR